MIIPILQMRRLRLTDVGKHFHVQDAVNEFGFPPILLTCVLCGPVALCDSHMKSL